MAKKPVKSKRLKLIVKTRPHVEKVKLKPSDYKWTWVDFDDWLVEKHLAKVHPRIIRDKIDVVNKNHALLKNSDAWEQKLAAFASLLEMDYSDEEKRLHKREQYEILLEDLVILKVLKFSSLVIPCSISFNRSTFKEAVSMNLLSVYGALRFEGAIFNKDVSFLELFRANSVSFSGSTFEKRLSILQFDLFNRGIEIEKLNASNMKVSGRFMLASNVGWATFAGSTFEAGVTLENCRFGKVPDFLGAKLERNPEVAGLLVAPPNMIPKTKGLRESEIRYWPFKLAEDLYSVAKYRKLKAMALAANDHEKDSEFFGYEMMAKRGHETVGRIPLFINSIYWHLSNYGQSYLRPICGMAFSWFVFWLLAIGLTTPQMGTLKAFSFSALHSLLNIVPVFGLLLRTNSTPEKHNSWYVKTYEQLRVDGFNVDLLTTFTVLQQIIGTVLLFLLFLGLRNKFRLK